MILKKTDAMATAGNLGLKVSTKKTKSTRIHAKVKDNSKLNGDEINVFHLPCI
jgi:hypothetical protein